MATGPAPHKKHGNIKGRNRRNQIIWFKTRSVREKQGFGFAGNVKMSFGLNVMQTIKFCTKISSNMNSYEAARRSLRLQNRRCMYYAKVCWPYSDTKEIAARTRTPYNLYSSKISKPSKRRPSSIHFTNTSWTCITWMSADAVYV